MIKPRQKILIKFRENTPPTRKHHAHKQINAMVVEEIEAINVQMITVESPNLDACLQHYNQCPEVEFVEPDHVYKALYVPNDPFFNDQWGLLKINSTRGWNVTRGSTTVPIAILDTGIDYNHPDLSDKIILNVNFSDALTFDDLYGHGTHVAGIAAAVTNNGIGVAGLAINPTLMNIKVLDDTGSGFASQIANGIVYAVDNGAKVINMSLGSAFFSSTILNAMKYAARNQVLMVGAAGNSGVSNQFYPAAINPCISVAALTPNDTRASFSNYGASWVDLAAPGVDILSTLPTNTNSIGVTNYGYLSGTSMAAPFVSGLAALLLSLEPNVGKVLQAITTTTVPIPGVGTLYENGRINVYRALLHVSG